MKTNLSEVRFFLPMKHPFNRHFPIVNLISLYLNISLLYGKELNLETYTFDELEKLIRKGEAPLDKKRKAELKNAQSLLEKMVKELGVDPSTLHKPANKKPGRKKSAAKKKASTQKPVKPKYRDPSNAKNPGSGRGKRPIWLQQALEKGAKLEEFAI